MPANHAIVGIVRRTFRGPTQVRSNRFFVSRQSMTVGRGTPGGRRTVFAACVLMGTACHLKLSVVVAILARATDPGVLMQRCVEDGASDQP